MKNRDRLLCLAAFPLLLLLCLTACGQQSEKQPEHTHKWEPANCTRGEFCFSCGETRGEALGHTWASATCTKPSHCSRCGITEGGLLDHNPQNGICTQCGDPVNTVVRLDGTMHGLGGSVYGDFKLAMQAIYGVGFPTAYSIYDATGVLQVQGTWGTVQTIPPVAIATKTQTVYTDFIALAPGTYTVEYCYYKEDSMLYTGNGDIYTFSYGGEASYGSCSFTVK